VQKWTNRDESALIENKQKLGDLTIFGHEQLAFGEVCAMSRRAIFA
jgi:hypothetical protein